MQPPMPPPLHFLISLLVQAIRLAASLSPDGIALSSLAATLQLPPSITSSWNTSHSTPCHWRGVRCDSRLNVVSLSLPLSNLSGQLGPDVGRLRFLQDLDISSNALSGSLPPELGNCTLLRSISLFENQLEGAIPESLFQIPNLEQVYLSQNWFSGLIPSNVGNASRLRFLWLNDNQLSGRVPGSISNCSRMEDLYISNNQLVGGLPEILGKVETLINFEASRNDLSGSIRIGPGCCSNLENLVLSSNNFSGEIPPGLGNCSLLRTLAALNNSLTGLLPPSLGLLSSLENLYLSHNALSGPIPPEIGKCRSLVDVSLSENQLQGQIPAELGSLRKLKSLRLFSNALEGEIPRAIWKIRTLEELLLYDNNISGELPAEVTGLRRLKKFTIYGNRFSGIIPPDLGATSSLEVIDFINNQFVGEIPPNICLRKRLQIFNLGTNLLHGSIPPGVGRCSSLRRMILSGNNLTGPLPEFSKNPNFDYMDVSRNSIGGPIPSSLANCSNLTSIDLSMNRITGVIPREIGSLVNLQRLNMSHNHLQGPLPAEMSRCCRLFSLDLGFNFLNGSIPASLRNLTELAQLVLQENLLTGGVPDFLSAFTKMYELRLGRNLMGGHIAPSLGELQNFYGALDLSDNGLTGELPPELGKLNKLSILDLSLNNLTGFLTPLDSLESLSSVNLSYNLFAGPIPGHLMRFVQSSPSSFLGNPGLCIPRTPGNSTRSAGIVGLSPCIRRSTKKAGLSRIQISMIALGSSLFCVILLLAASYLLLKCGTPAKDEVSVHEGSSFRLHRVMEATENFNDKFVIGRGTHGTVYKALLGTDEVYAVKRLIFEGHKGTHASMVREIQTVGRIRHRNLVKLEDFWLRKDYGLILYAYMENGSLHDVLHEIKPPPLLEWDVMYKIALGTAQGLAYLQYDCSPPIVHRDIKPKNILLDSDMEPHISDFGIAKIMDQSSASTQSSKIIGTVGYISPETAFSTRKSKESDVYSYGVVLLELITRRMPLDTCFPEDTDIVSWVKSATSNDAENINAVVDPLLRHQFMDSRILEEVSNVLVLALKCTEKEASDRPSMRDVVTQLIDVKAHARRFSDV